MIYDRLENAKCYHFPEKFDRVFKFIEEYKGMPVGAYDLGDGVVVQVQKNTLSPREGRMAENHRRYIDLHCMVTGVERVGVSLATDARTARPYNEAGDIEFFETEVDQIPLRPGQFLVLYPQDLHLANIGNGEVTDKLVFKIPV